MTSRERFQFLRSDGRIKMNPGKSMDSVTRNEVTAKPLKKLKIKILFEQGWPAQFSGLVIAAFFVFLFRKKASPVFLTFWSSTLFFLTSFRFLWSHYFIRNHVRLNRDFD